MVHKIASPFGGYYIYPDDPENLFQQMLGVKPKVGQEASHEMTPAGDIYKDESAYFASIKMPGVIKEDVKISCSGGNLTIPKKLDRHKTVSISID